MDCVVLLTSKQIGIDPDNKQTSDKDNFVFDLHFRMSRVLIDQKKN